MTVTDFDPINKRIDLSHRHDKSDEDRRHPIPTQLVARLTDFIQSDAARRLYDKMQNRRDATRADIPENPLLFVPGHAARMLDGIAARAGIAKLTAEGKLDFHSLRTTYINMVIQEETDPKTAQAMARHTTARMTYDTYGRVMAKRMRAVADGIGERMARLSERLDIDPQAGEDGCI